MSNLIKQFVNDVEDFSSQYGSQFTYCHVANNLKGRPFIFPAVADSSRAFSLKTYGKWWREKGYSSSDNFPHNEEFVDVSFETAVLPLEVHIYEIFNTGSVVRIWGSLKGKNWTLLWSGKPKESNDQEPLTVFSPKLIKTDDYINFLRIVMDPSLQLYYPALDAILLIGSPKPKEELKYSLHLQSPKEYFEKSNYEDFYKMITEGLKYLTSEDVKKLAVNDEIRLTELLKSTFIREAGESAGYFNLLPKEIIIFILRKVDLKTLCRVSSTCKLLHQYASDPILYQNLNLKMCWPIVNNGTLMWLKNRCSQITTLDLSRCGNYGVISSISLNEFLVCCGYSLRILILDNCQFVSCTVLRVICSNCPNLEAFSISRNKLLTGSLFAPIASLKKLSYLNLSGCAIDNRRLQYILQKLGYLTHLKLIGCYLLTNMDEIAAVLSVSNTKLTHLEIWKTQGLTSKGLKLLSSLVHLQVADLGWSISGFVTDGLKEFLTGCRNLRILFLTALRALTDIDVMCIAKLGGNLEQINIMGNRNVTSDAVKYLLFSCQRLELLDVSYSEQIRNNQVVEWREIFPRVAIKNFSEYRL